MVSVASKVLYDCVCEALQLLHGATDEAILAILRQLGFSEALYNRRM